VFCFVFCFCLWGWGGGGGGGGGGVKVKLHVKILLKVFSVLSHFSLNFCPVLLSITFLFGPTVPQQFIVLVHQINLEMLSMYSLLHTFLVFVVSVVTVASVAIVMGSDISLSLPKCTVIFF